MIVITYIILKVESMIKKTIVINHTIFTVVTFKKIVSLISIHRNSALITSNFQKHFHLDNPVICFSTIL